MSDQPNPEAERLNAARGTIRRWRRWGPYLSERQWGTVREDYSAAGDAWGSFPHDQARSRAYRWGEDGLLGICDDQGLLCFALSLWNGHDPILKERLFGLTNPEGNHGEDVKECYYYLDATPTAAYLKGLYKYPQRAFPYSDLIATNGQRDKLTPEYELFDTGVFDGDAYFDVFVEYAKASPDDILVRLTIHNHGREPAPLHVLPSLWFRNTWSWRPTVDPTVLPRLVPSPEEDAIRATHAQLGRFVLMAAPGPDGRRPRLLFTDNVTNTRALYGDPSGPAYSKDAFHRYVIGGDSDAVNPDRVGTKAAAHYALVVDANARVELHLRLCAEGDAPNRAFGPAFDRLMSERLEDADIFYSGRTLPGDEAILRQACAGLIWSKQVYHYPVRQWLEGDPLLPPPAERRSGRNSDWQHVNGADVISMPDKWEFPWFAAWDLAFHTYPFAAIDRDFAREQLLLMLSERYLHPNGQLPAYELRFGDVNPPVHAWACLNLYRRGLEQGVDDTHFLKRAFHKLLLNFTWWVNRKDEHGKNLFGGGFLGLDNIGVFDRSMVLPDNVRLDQADGTAWMGLFCTAMLSMALELSKTDPVYEDLALKFIEHFVAISASLNAIGGSGMWHAEDGFYYDHLRAGELTLPLRVRSLVGLLPLVACSVIDGRHDERSPETVQRLQWLSANVPEMATRIVSKPFTAPDGGITWRHLLALPSREHLEQLLRVMFDESEFLSPYGIRSVSKYHLEHPFVFEARGQRFEVQYQPGESDSWMFGGNSNWRGPVWVPMNVLIVEALLNYHHFYGDELLVEFPTGSGERVNLRQAALRLADRIVSLMRPGPGGHRPIHGGEPRYARDPEFSELLLFYEYFHGDTGRGCGASHQTGWSALIGVLAALLRRASDGDLP